MKKNVKAKVAPKNAVSHEDRIKALKKRTADMELLKHHNELKWIIKHFPEYREKMLKQCSDWGIRQEAANNAKGVDAMARQVEEQVVGVDADEGSLIERNSLPRQGMIATCYTTISSFSVVGLQELLAFIEPQSLSKSNLRAKNMVVHGQRQSAQLALARLLEICTGIDQDFSLKGKHRRWENFLQFLLDQSQLRGRRGRDVQLPPDYDAVDGIYRLFAEDGQLMVMHRFLKFAIVLPEDWQPKCVDDDDIVSAYTCEYNWSETRAQLVRADAKHSSDSKCLMSTLFPSQNTEDGLQQAFDACLVNGAKVFGVEEESDHNQRPGQSKKVGRLHHDLKSASSKGLQKISESMDEITDAAYRSVKLLGLDKTRTFTGVAHKLPQAPTVSDKTTKAEKGVVTTSAQKEVKLRSKRRNSKHDGSLQHDDDDGKSPGAATVQASSQSHGRRLRRKTSDTSCLEADGAVRGLEAHGAARGLEADEVTEESHSPASSKAQHSTAAKPSKVSASLSGDDSDNGSDIDSKKAGKGCQEKESPEIDWSDLEKAESSSDEAIAVAVGSPIAQVEEKEDEKTESITFVDERSFEPPPPPS